MTEGNEEDYGIELLFHAVYYEGYPFRKGDLTKTFRKHLIKKNVKYLVDWIDKQKKKEGIKNG